jgi:cysteine sulfinate desulfinase/cysteine desulfurase-like protein
MLPYLYSRCGNPGSAHAYGQPARAAVAKARAAVAAVMGAESPEEIVFASCGTEAINWALRAGIRAGWTRLLRLQEGGGGQQQQQQQQQEEEEEEEEEEEGEGTEEERQRRPHVITTAVEHPAVLALLRRMEAEGDIDLDVVRSTFLPLLQ